MAEKHPQHYSREEQIGYHKGALNTLVGERNELMRLVQITESFIHAHAKELEKLGVRMDMGKSEPQNKK